MSPILKVAYPFLIIVLLACSNEVERGGNEIQKVTFIQIVKQADQINLDDKSVAGEYIEFIFNQSFSNNGYDSANSLFITIPASDTAFNFKNDSTHRFIHIVSTKACKGLCDDFITEKIDKAEIKGTKVKDVLWRIEAKTKYFNFVRNVNALGNSYSRDEIILKNQ